MNNEADRHGTNMAGLIASHPNNSICSVGVAYDVSLGMDFSTSGLTDYFAPLNYKPTELQLCSE